MKLLILRSKRTGSEPTGSYLQEFDTRYAERVIGNLQGHRDFCSACGTDCVACRKPYGRRHSDDIAAIVDFPAVLPHVLESPAGYVPAELPPHDVILAVHIHEQILLGILDRCREWGTRGVVVPLEAPDWISHAARARAHEICEARGIEISFPKPFCSFAPPHGGILAKFRERFLVGRPAVELTLVNGTITQASVTTSAACGATYCVARWLAGRNVKENLQIEVISKWLHAYPCTASMEWDYELGDTPLHAAGQAHYTMLSGIQVTSTPGGMVRSPTGIALAEPIPARENLENIERAKDLILDVLRKRATVTFKELRSEIAATPAAVNSALVLLKTEGKIRTQGTTILTTIS